MPNYTYLIVGGGMTAGAAVGGIAEVDPNGSVGLIGAESHPPYDRPPLSKGLWKGKALDSIWRKLPGQSVELRQGRKAVTLDAEHKRVTDDQGAVYTYDKLLLATGGTPRRLPFGGDDVIYFRTLDDYERLRGLTGRGRRFAVVGGGFIGSEVAAALAMTGEKVVMAFPGDGIGGRLFPADLSGFLIGNAEYFADPENEVGIGHAVGRIREAFEWVEDPGKFLYGSDWPLAPMASYLSFVARAIQPEHHERVFYQNAKELFGLG